MYNEERKRKKIENILFFYCNYDRITFCTDIRINIDCYLSEYSFDGITDDEPNTVGNVKKSNEVASENHNLDCTFY